MREIPQKRAISRLNLCHRIKAIRFLRTFWLNCI